jgi:hypothetical protein
MSFPAFGSSPKVVLTGFAVIKEIKGACTRPGLPTEHFSSHSLLKGVVKQRGRPTQRRQLGSGFASNERNVCLRTRPRHTRSGEPQGGLPTICHRHPAHTASIAGTEMRIHEARLVIPGEGHLKILDPLSPAPTKIRKGNRSRGAGQEKKGSLHLS